LGVEEDEAPDTAEMAVPGIVFVATREVTALQYVVYIRTSIFHNWRKYGLN
jgi:hypothetical protein